MRSGRHSGITRHLQSHGADEALVIVRVFPHHVDAPWRTVTDRMGGVAKLHLKRRG